MKSLILLIFIWSVFVKASLAQQQPVKITGIPQLLKWENTPNSVSLKAGVLEIEAGAKTDMFRDPNVTYNTDNAPKLMFVPDKNFVLTATIEHSFVNKWDAGALVLKADSLNWIKFCFERDYLGYRRIVSVVTKDVSDDANAQSVNENFAHLKIAKADNVVTLYVSTDGKKWLLIRHLQFNTDKEIKVGFLAQSPVGQRCKVKFSNIKYEAKKIKDPYAGN
jgi:regulation of enolase protein 1 (concanavalin A-like superfamily)